jgi:hypothetical protein
VESVLAFSNTTFLSLFVVYASTVFFCVCVTLYFNHGFFIFFVDDGGRLVIFFISSVAECSRTVHIHWVYIVTCGVIILCHAPGITTTYDRRLARSRDPFSPSQFILR